jgi:hypothetical protein
VSRDAHRNVLCAVRSLLSEMDRNGSAEARATCAIRSNEKIVWSGGAERRAFQRGRAFAGLLWFRLLICGHFAVSSAYYCICSFLLATPEQAPWVIGVASWCATLLVLASGVGAWPFLIEDVRYVVTNRRLLIVGRISRFRSMCVGESLVVGDVPCEAHHLAFPRRVAVREVRPGIGSSVSVGGRIVTIYHHDWRDEDGDWHEARTTLHGVIDPQELVRQVRAMAHPNREPCPRNSELSVASRCGCKNAGRGQTDADRAAGPNETLGGPPGCLVMDQKEH